MYSGDRKTVSIRMAISLKITIKRALQIVEIEWTYEFCIKGNLRQINGSLAKMGLMNSTIQLKSLLQKVMEDNQTEAEQRGNTICLDLGPDVPETLSADLVKLTQALNGLVQQAVLRTEKGSITLRVEAGEEGDSDDLSISVEDTGWEPETETIQTILDPTASSALWRQDEKLAEIAMPLRLSAKFVSILGGRLTMNHKPSGATCFTFSLSSQPDQADSRASEAPKSAPVSSSGSPEETGSAQQALVSILLVDDVQENRALLEVLLKKLGYHCVHSSNGKEAVDQCNQQAFDLILMDLQMPIMDGFEAAGQIRKSRFNEKTPIIAMTASGQKGDDLRALDAGCNDCLGKPISRERLQRKIWRLLAQNKQLKEAEEGKEILSFLEGDPDYQKAVETFVDNLPGKIEEMRKAFEKKDLKDLAFKAHALKGLGGFAGFPIFTEKAKSLEENVKAEDLDRIREQLDEMVQLCMRTKLQNK